MKSDLKKLIEVIVDQEMAALEPSGPVFEPRSVPKLVRGTGEYVISRDFSIRVTPEIGAALQLTSAEVAEAEENDGIFESEWELSIDIDNPYYQKGSPARLHGHPDTWHPGDPEEFEVGDWHVDGILLYGARSIAVFDPEDTKRLKAIVDDLTEDEIDRFREQYIENLESDYDEPDYYD